MTFPVATLDELIERGVIQLSRGKIISKKDLASTPGAYPVYSSAQDNDGKFGEYGNYMFDEELITWSVDGGGKFFYRPRHKFSVTNVGGILRIVNTSILDYRFLYYVLTLRHSGIEFDWVRKAHPSVIRELYREIPLPPLSEQHRIVDLLTRAESIVRLRRDAQKKAAELVPAIFHEMFGDPSANPRGFRIMALSEVSEVISGVAKGRSLEPGESIEVPYMRVANVKDGYLDLSEVKTIAIKRSEMSKLRIEVGDLLMTEGGDPDKLGRAALWNGEVGDCVHQNHVFKVRSDRSQIVPEYLKALAGSPYGKAYFLSVAKKTTGIASINKTQLSAFLVVVPPMKDQERFSRFVGDAASIESQQEFAASKASATFHALLAQSFSRGA